MTRIRVYVGGLLLALGFVIIGFGGGLTSAASPKLPDPAVDDAAGAITQPMTLVVAGGCFWGIEEVFQHVRGVKDAVSGYSGGAAKTANYDMVSSGTTGHAESVRITYDPSQVTVGQLLKVFFSVAHDPTQLNRQGPDEGPQYRSVIFYFGERQQQIARAYIEQLGAAGVFRGKIVTQLVPLTTFYPAEDYHQDYASKHPNNGYILVNDRPKVENLRKEFPALYVK